MTMGGCETESLLQVQVVVKIRLRVRLLRAALVCSLLA